MLLAASGILLVVGPALLSRAFHAILDAIPPDQEFAPEADRWLPIWWVAWGVYFTMVVGGACLMLWSRRERTVIYNVDLEVFGQVLSEALKQAGASAVQMGNRILLSGPADVGSNGELAVQTFPALSNVTLRWRRVPPKLRTAIERHLQRGLDGDTHALDNPASNWLLAMTGVLLGMIFLTGMVWILLTYFPRR